MYLKINISVETLKRRLKRYDCKEKHENQLRQVNSQRTYWVFLSEGLSRNLAYREMLEWRRSGVFIVNFGHISHLVLVFLLLTLNM